MVYALNPERLRTKLCLKHKTTLTGQKEREQRRVPFQSLRTVIQYPVALKAILPLNSRTFEPDGCLNSRAVQDVLHRVPDQSPEALESHPPLFALLLSSQCAFVL